MEVLKPTNFVIDASGLTVSHTHTNLADRLSLFGTETYYFRGTVTGSMSPTSPTSDFTFVIDFTDDCRTATMSPLTAINTAFWQYDITDFATIPTFIDSVDGAAPTGICGEKVFSLDAGHPAYLSLTEGLDGINDSD